MLLLARQPDPVPGDEPAVAMEADSLPEYVSIARGMVREGFAMDSKPVTYLAHTAPQASLVMSRANQLTCVDGLCCGSLCLSLCVRQVGALEKGESVHALEVRVNESGFKRVRFARGWTSETSQNGQTILQEISAAQAQAGARRPQLRIVTTAGLPVLADVLDVRGFRRARPRDYRLRYTPSVLTPFLSVCLSVCLSVSLSLCLCVCQVDVSRQNFWDSV